VLIPKSGNTSLRKESPTYGTHWTTKQYARSQRMPLRTVSTDMDHKMFTDGSVPVMLIQDSRSSEAHQVPFGKAKPDNSPGELKLFLQCK